MPENVDDALNYEYLVSFMKLELVWFAKNDTWELVPKPVGVNVKGLKMGS